MTDLQQAPTAPEPASAAEGEESSLILTPTQTSGPLYGFALIHEEFAASVDPDAADAVRIRGRLLDGAGEPFGYPDGFLEIFSGEQWTRTRADENGAWELVLGPPAAAPDLDGVAQALHYNVLVLGRGLMGGLHTRLYLPDQDLSTDPVLAHVPEEQRSRLVGTPVDGGLEFVIHLQGEDQTPFFTE